MHWLVLGVGAGIACSALGCASGNAAEGIDVGPPRDTGVRDTGARDGGSSDAGPARDTGARDTGPARDVGTDTGGGRMCGTMTCTGFTHCVGTTCVAYPMCAGNGTCPTPGDVCTARRCVPGTDDVDGDGSPAAMDCDETDPTRSPLLPEICNSRDDNCNNMVDDGDPNALCASDPAHGTCMSGVCGCPPNLADVDLAVPGCECALSPTDGTGASCGAAIDMGNVFDEASAGTLTLTAMGNAVAEGREVWYHFRAVDTPDSVCDHFDVHVSFATNPSSTYEFLVLRGACDATPSCPDCTADTCVSFTDYRFAIDSPTGQCPCQTTPSTSVNLCSDDSGDYYVRVRRRMGAAPTCGQYTLQVTNGMM